MIPFKLAFAAALLGWLGCSQLAAAQGLGVSIGVGGDSGVSVSVGTSSDGDSGSESDATVSLDTDPTPLSHEVALEAVRSNRALPLETILVAARTAANGDIIDAELISLRGILLYEFKVLAATGDVGELYFYALSGQQVETD